MKVMNLFQGHMQLLKEENIVQKLSRFSFVGLLDQVQLANRPSLSCGFVRIITYSTTCKRCIFKLCDCTSVRWVQPANDESLSCVIVQLLGKCSLQMMYH